VLKKARDENKTRIMGCKRRAERRIEEKKE
jgi:hypothetical protein